MARYAQTSPLNRLEGRFSHVGPRRNGETSCLRGAFVVPLWWKAPKISIADSAKAATLSYNHTVTPGTSLAVYTDGSGIHGRVGASAVIRFYLVLGMGPIIAQTRSAYLSFDTGYTFYFGELYGGTCS